MTLKDLFNLCANCTPHTEIMLYDSVADYHYNTPNWKSYEAYQLFGNDSTIGKFEVRPGYIIVALGID